MTGSNIIEHKTAIESSAKALHHEAISEFCDHGILKDRCKLIIFPLKSPEIFLSGKRVSAFRTVIYSETGCMEIIIGSPF